MKLAVFFSKALKRARELRVNKTKITSKNASNQYCFEFGGNKNSNYDKEPGFWFLCKFLICTLTIRWRRFMFFKHCLFFLILSHFSDFRDAGNKLIVLEIKFWIKWVRVLASKCTILLLCSKPVQRNYRSFFIKFKKWSCKLRVNVTY